MSQSSQKSTCARASFFNKVTGWGTFIKKRLWQRCFRVNFAKFLKELFPSSTSGRLKLTFTPYDYIFRCWWFDIIFTTAMTLLVWVMYWEIILFTKGFTLRQCYWRLAMLIFWDYQCAIAFENKKNHQDHLSSSSSLLLFQSFLIFNFRKTEI